MKDELYQAAVDAVRGFDKPVISHIQRQLKVGYNRAARLMNALEDDGVVTPFDLNGKREVIYPDDEKDGWTKIEPKDLKATIKKQLQSKKTKTTRTPAKKPTRKPAKKKTTSKKLQKPNNKTTKKPEAVDEYGLSLKHRQFADLYRGGPDEVVGKASKCYKLVYPTCKESTAESKGPALVRKEQVSEYLKLKAKELEDKCDINAAWVLNRLKDELEADVSDIYYEKGGLKPINEWPLIWRQGLISGIEVKQEFEYSDGGKEPDGFMMKIKQSNRVKQLELAGRHVAVQAFKDKVEIVDDIGRAERLNRARMRRNNKS